jgi:predicted dehydrogenase
MKEMNWGIIGCGDVTEVKSGPALQNVYGSNLVAVMRRNGKLAEDYAHRHNVKKWYDNANALINDPEVNGVYIATPPSSHKEYTLAVAEAGKIVYVEKPMALNYNECLEMLNICEKNNVPLFVAYYRRALPRFLKVKSLIDDGVLGKVRFVNSILYKKPQAHDIEGIYHWRVDPEIAGGGYFFDLAPHTIDIFHYYFGDVKTVKGYYSNQMKLYNAEDLVSAILIFENDVHAICAWNFNSYDDLDRIEIIGEKGKITFSMFDNNPILLEIKDGIQKFDIDNPTHIQQPLIQTIIDELNDYGKCPSTGSSGSKINLIMDEIFKC